MAPTRFRWLMATAVLLLLIIALMIGLIATGLFDPAPVGPLRWNRQDLQLSVAPQAREIIWLREEVPDTAITIRATGALHSGEEDSGYGLIFGDEESYWAVAVSPLGYLAIWETTQAEGEVDDNYFLHWQTWPHINEAFEGNEIWVELVGDRASVRLNREWLWEGEIGDRSRRIGLLGESFGAAAEIVFPSVELFAE